MDTETAIHVRDLIKDFHIGKNNELRALDGFSLDVPKGHITGLLGPNGAGKSTLLKILTTLLPQTSGHAAIMGFDVAANPLSVRRNICVVLQQNAIEQYLTVEDNFETYGRFHNLTTAERRERSARLIELFGLESERKQKAIDLSGGYKRRVQVAKVFMIDAPVVFLDEATTGMDPINKRATIDAVAEEARRGRTILLTTHLLDEAEELCDSIVFIDKGRKILEGDLFSIKALSRNIVDVSVTYAHLTPDIRERIGGIPALKREYQQNTALLTVDTTAASPHATVGMLLELGATLSFEVRGATLEDVFLQLLGKEKQ
jgi:ABC-2 type transport system ATP-binding protein